MPGPGKLALLFCYGVTCVCWVASFPFYATHKLPSSNVPVNCGGNRTVFMVTGLGHRLCGEDYFITKKENLTQFGKVSLSCSLPGFFFDLNNDILVKYFQYNNKHQITVVIAMNAIQIVYFIQVTYISIHYVY